MCTSNFNSPCLDRSGCWLCASCAVWFCPWMVPNSWCIRVIIGLVKVRILCAGFSYKLYWNEIVHLLMTVFWMDISVDQFYINYCWNATVRSLRVVCLHFGGIYCFHLQGQRESQAYNEQVTISMNPVFLIPYLYIMPLYYYYYYYL
jgi:hypothetical protein